MARPIHLFQAMLNDRDGISPEELARRQQYLKEQRDRLIQMKKEEREKAFEEAHRIAGFLSDTES